MILTGAKCSYTPSVSPIPSMNAMEAKDILLICIYHCLLSVLTLGLSKIPVIRSGKKHWQYEPPTNYTILRVTTPEGLI